MTLSSRAKAFFVDNLLQSSSPSPTDSLEREDQGPRGARGAKQELTNDENCPLLSGRPVPLESGVASDRRPPSSPKSEIEYRHVPVVSCFCHGDMSFCMHPGVINVRDQHGMGNLITTELLHSDLWSSFHRLGTEMIITKSGRRMFPSLKLRIDGLDPMKKYETRLEFLQPDCKKYRYIYHSSRWMISGSGDALLSTPCHVSPESPLNGQAICSQVLSFERLKLTNHEHCKPGQVSLISMQKFQPRVVIQEVGGSRFNSTALECYHIVFPQTSFMAVTAYQNQQITTLKIASNPFAKGFRDSGRLRYPHDSSITGQLPSLYNYNIIRPIRMAACERGFHPYGNPAMLERRSPWEAETNERQMESMEVGGRHILDPPAPFPLFLSPTIPFPPYLPTSPSQTLTTSALQRLIRHNSSPFRPVLTPGERHVSSMPSSSSSSPSPSSSSSISPLLLRQSPLSPMTYDDPKPTRIEDQQRNNVIIMRHRPTTNSSKSPETHFVKAQYNSAIKQEPDDEEKTEQIKHENNEGFPRGDNAQNPNNVTHYEVLNNITIPTSRLNVSEGHHQDAITNPGCRTAHMQDPCNNCVAFNGLRPAVLNVNLGGASNLLPRNLYQHPLAVPGRHHPAHLLRYQYG